MLVLKISGHQSSFQLLLSKYQTRHLREGRERARGSSVRSIGTEKPCCRSFGQLSHHILSGSKEKGGVAGQREFGSLYTSQDTSTRPGVTQISAVIPLHPTYSGNGLRYQKLVSQMTADPIS